MARDIYPFGTAAVGSRITLPLHVGMATLVGYVYDGPPPWKRGNCGDIGSHEAGWYRCVSMNAANIRAFAKANPEIAAGVECEVVALKHRGRGVRIVDERVPAEWRQHSCMVCCQLAEAPNAE